MLNFYKKWEFPPLIIQYQVHYHHLQNPNILNDDAIFCNLSQISSSEHDSNHQKINSVSITR